MFLAIEAGQRQAEIIEAFLCRITDIAGSGGASDIESLRNYAALCILMTITLEFIALVSNREGGSGLIA